MSQLDPRLLLQGYATGIFPMADSRETEDLFWVEPRSRAILPLDGFHLSRSLRRTIQREIEDQLSEKILFGEIEGGQIVIVDVEGVNPDAPEGSRSTDDKARFTFRGEPKPAVTVPDAPPMDMAGAGDE